jgi:hypothetical protein
MRRAKWRIVTGVTLIVWIYGGPAGAVPSDDAADRRSDEPAAPAAKGKTKPGQKLPKKKPATAPPGKGQTSTSNAAGESGTSKVPAPEKTPGAGSAPGVAPKPGKESDEPGKGLDEPGRTKGEPRATSDEPGRGKEEPKVRVTTPKKVDPPNLFGFGAHVRGIFLPSGLLKLGLQAGTYLASVSTGGEFVWRRPSFDLVAAVNFGFYSLRDGNFVGKSKEISTDTDYVQFKNFNMLAFSVTAVWHYKFLPWLSLVYGAGLGLAIRLGDIYRISNGGGGAGKGGCTPDNVQDINQCYPKGMDLNNREKWLAENSGSGADTPSDPHRFREDDVWPVFPVVHLMVGLNFKISEQFSVRVDGGIYNALYAGATLHYFF